MSQPEARAQSTEAPRSKAGTATLTLSDIEAGLGALPRAKMARFISVGGSIAVIALVAYRWIEGKDRTSLVVIGVALLALLFMSRNPARRIAKRVYDSLPADAKEIAVAVSEEGFRVTSSGTESTLAWSQVRRCVEARAVFVVFVSQHDAQILPKRAFSEGEVESIRQWAKTKIVKHHESWLTPELRTRMMIWLIVFALIWTAWTYFGNR